MNIQNSKPALFALFWIACLAIFAALLLSDIRPPVQAASHSVGPDTKSQQPTPVRSADAACRNCHQAIFDKYLQTPMANASGVAADGLIPGSFTHTRSGVRYGVAARADGAVLSYQMPSQGVAVEQQLLYYLGSGNLGRTYLYSIDGYLLESPVAYMSSLRGYAMAPGLADVSSVPSALPMNARCMRCHMSDVQEPLPGIGNRFAGLPFLHGGITCEQCHGDTTQHVLSKGKQPVLKLASLPAPARDSVCISCHLEGDTNVELRGRSVTQYRPGEDIRKYLSYFVVPDNSGRSVTEIEQLNQSVCKRRSGEHMSCMSCHDPHSHPDAEHRVSFYRAKCLTCHSGASFAATHHPENPDCTSCHMPKSEVRDTPHVAWTDHRILKVPQMGASTVVSSGAMVPALDDETITSRELGLAYYNLVLKGELRWVGLAVSNLADAWAKDPTDGEVGMTLASIYQRQGRSKEAQRIYESALKDRPAEVEAASNLAMILAREGDIATAQRMWASIFDRAQDQEAIGINLAVADCMLGDAANAQSALQTVLRFSPASTKTREELQRIRNGGCSRH